MGGGPLPKVCISEYMAIDYAVTVGIMVLGFLLRHLFFISLAFFLDFYTVFYLFISLCITR